MTPLPAEAAVAGAPPEAAAEPLPLWGAEVLAPMVRASTLPLRMECLRYGADLVWGEEIIDKKVIGGVRVENPAFGTVDYVSPTDKGLFFNTRPEERDRVIFQLGTADPVLSVEAALTVCRDVRGIDINMGCPKSFSVRGGMGAALLEKPEVASEILKSLRRNLPAGNSLTCKIRMLATTEKTRDFMRCCEASGAEAITVHCRTRAERPAQPAHWDEIVRLWDAVRVPVIANGDFFSRRQIDEFWKHCCSNLGGDTLEEYVKQRRGPAAVMVARGAMWNPSVFCRGGREPPSFEEVCRNYALSSIASNATQQNTRWMLNNLNTGGPGVTPPTHFDGKLLRDFGKAVNVAKSMAGICGLLGVPYTASAWPAQAHTPNYYRGSAGSAAFEEALARVSAPKGAGVDLSPAGADKRALAEGGAADGGDVAGDGSSAKKAKVDA